MTPGGDASRQTDIGTNLYVEVCLELIFIKGKGYHKLYLKVVPIHLRDHSSLSTCIAISTVLVIILQKK